MSNGCVCVRKNEDLCHQYILQWGTVGVCSGSPLISARCVAGTIIKSSRVENSRMHPGLTRGCYHGYLDEEFGVDMDAGDGLLDHLRSDGPGGVNALDPQVQLVQLLIGHDIGPGLPQLPHCLAGLLVYLRCSKIHGAPSVTHV